MFKTRWTWTTSQYKDRWTVTRWCLCFQIHWVSLSLISFPSFLLLIRYDPFKHHDVQLLPLFRPSVPHVEMFIHSFGSSRTLRGLKSDTFLPAVAQLEPDLTSKALLYIITTKTTEMNKTERPTISPTDPFFSPPSFSPPSSLLPSSSPAGEKQVWVSVSVSIDILPHGQSGQSGRVPRAPKPIGALGLQLLFWFFLEQFLKNIGMNVVLKCSMIIKSMY